MAVDQRVIGLVATAVRRERESAGVSLSELAKRAGIGKSTLSQLESGSGNPSLETLWSLSVALDVPVSRLLEPPDAGDPVVRLVRDGEGPTIGSSVARYRAAVLRSGAPAVRSDIYRVSAEPGDDRVSAPHTVGTVEHVILISGRALVGPLHRPEELRPGDYLRYPGDASHLFRALEPGTRAALISDQL